MSEGIVEGTTTQERQRLAVEEASPEVRLDGSDEETQGGDTVLAEAAITEDVQLENEHLETARPGAGVAEASGTEPTGEETLLQTEATSPVGMQYFMDDFDRAYRIPRRGDIIEGVIASIDKDGILVDVGTKSEGVVPAHEVQSLSSEFLHQLNVGDNVLVYVLQPENQNGHPVLSLNRARAEQGWRTVQKKFEEGHSIEAEVIDCNRGGLIVDIEGVRGFVPISQVVGLRQDRIGEEELAKRMAGMVGKRIPLKVIEVNRGRNRLILSERMAAQELRAQRKEQLLNELREGEIRHGRVSSVCDFGAFVDLGGADGLVHLSELSWGQVAHPSEVVAVDDEVEVYVLGVDHEKKKIALSLRRSQPGPWARIGEKYKVGDLVTGTVTKLTTFGAFARIEDGVEGLIHVSELGEGRIPHPRNVVKEGDSLTLRVIRIDPTRRRLGLSLKQAQYEEEENEGVVAPAKSREMDLDEPMSVANAQTADTAERNLAGATADTVGE